MPHRNREGPTRAVGAREPHTKDTTIRTYGKDQYHRTMADVLLLDCTNVDQELVKEGWC